MKQCTIALAIHILIARTGLQRPKIILTTNNHTAYARMFLPIKCSAQERILYHIPTLVCKCAHTQTYLNFHPSCKLTIAPALAPTFIGRKIPDQKINETVWDVFQIYVCLHYYEFICLIYHICPLTFSNSSLNHSFFYIHEISECTMFC